jgi:hypothetical protein
MQLDEKAIWKQRFRAPNVAWTQIAQANHARGLAISNTSGKYQLYAWNVPSGALKQLTEQSAGIFSDALSGDGRYVYYLDDKQGNEIGHIVRVPFENGEALDLTPDLPLYSSFSLASSGSGNRFGFTAVTTDGFSIYSLETKANGEISTPHQLFNSHKIAGGPIYSYGGEIAIVVTTDRATVQHFNLLAFDTITGEQIS